MFDFLLMGSPLFMGILTLLLFAIILFSVRLIIQGTDADQNRLKSTELIKSLGLLSLIIGMLGFLIGMYSAMSAIESVGAISPAVLAGGLKVGLITPTYGLVIYGFGHLVSIFLR